MRTPVCLTVLINAAEHYKSKAFITAIDLRFFFFASTLACEILMPTGGRSGGSNEPQEGFTGFRLIAFPGIR
jgi:hypothetical protein